MSSVSEVSKLDGERRSYLLPDPQYLRMNMGAAMRFR
jgi:hypothetical protein